MDCYGNFSVKVCAKCGVIYQNESCPVCALVVLIAEEITKLKDKK